MRSARIQSILDARAQGYEGDACDDCGAMTMVRNGACLKCVSCGCRLEARRSGHVPRRAVGQHHSGDEGLAVLARLKGHLSWIHFQRSRRRCQGNAGRSHDHHNAQRSTGSSGLTTTACHGH